MASPGEIARFLDVWTSSWRAERDRSRRIFIPGGGVRYPGDPALYNPDDRPPFTDLLREVAPDLRMTLCGWAERDAVLYGEWKLECTLAARRLSLGGINRFDLRGDRAAEATVFMDRMSVVEFLEPGRGPVSLPSLIARAAAGR